MPCTIPHLAVVDMLRTAQLSPVACTITGGDTVNSEMGGYRVPKRDLVAAVQVPLEQDRLHIVMGLPESELLSRELLNFRVTINTQTAHDNYSAWRERDHDDLGFARRPGIDQGHPQPHVMIGVVIDISGGPGTGKRPGMCSTHLRGAASAGLIQEQRSTIGEAPRTIAGVVMCSCVPP